MPPLVEKEYSVHLDNKNRFAIRGAKTKYWSVKVLSDGHLLVSPQKLVGDPPISKEVLDQIGRSVENLKKGKVFGPIDVSAARELLASDSPRQASERRVKPRSGAARKLSSREL